MNTPALQRHPDEDRHWLTFRIGAQLYAARLSDVSEVIRDDELTPVPGSATDLLGVRHLRGHIVPVMDGRRRLGLPAQPEADPLGVRIVLLSHAGQALGLKVDAVGELLDSEGLEIAPPPPGRLERDDDPVSGVLPWRDGFVVLLDARRLYRMNGDGDHVA